MGASAVATAVRAWLQTWVVGLSLCPFAGGPMRAGRVRLVISEAQDMEGALVDVMRECEHLVSAPPEAVDTSLVVVPGAWADWEDFLDAVAALEDLVLATQLDDRLQIVGFHPDYVFADSEGPEDGADRVNRAPWPLIHLLRVEQVAQAIASHPNPQEIPARNAALLRSGEAEVEARWQRIRRLAGQAPLGSD